jgi:copper(I)-binding protein
MRRRVLLMAAAAIAATGSAGAASAPRIAVADAWARPTPPGATTGAVYAVLTNRSASADALVSASSPAAARVELHVMTMAGGVMSMRAMALPAAVPAGGALRFAPGGAHIMLTGLKGPLSIGAHVPVTLTFRRAGAVRIDAVVANAAPAGAMPGMKM